MIIWALKLSIEHSSFLKFFALRARSREGKLQVELAQLDYLLLDYKDMEKVYLV